MTTKLIEPRYCPLCKVEVKKDPLIREHWCHGCQKWIVGIRLVNENVSTLKSDSSFTYDDMGCYMERE